MEGGEEDQAPVVEEEEAQAEGGEEEEAQAEGGEEEQAPVVEGGEEDQAPVVEGGEEEQAPVVAPVVEETQFADDDDVFNWWAADDAQAAGDVKEEDTEAAAAAYQAAEDFARQNAKAAAEEAARRAASASTQVCLAKQATNYCNFAQAAAYWKSAGEWGYPDAAHQQALSLQSLASQYHNQGLFKAAVRHWCEAVQLEVTSRRMSPGQMSMFSKPLHEDAMGFYKKGHFKAAQARLGQAVAWGSASAQAYLGTLCLLGTAGVQKDDVWAAQLHHASARSGNALSKIVIAWMQSHGVCGIKQDLGRAIQLCYEVKSRKVNDQDTAQACELYDLLRLRWGFVFVTGDDPGLGPDHAFRRVHKLVVRLGN